MWNTGFQQGNFARTIKGFMRDNRLLKSFTNFKRCFSMPILPTFGGTVIGDFSSIGHSIEYVSDNIPSEWPRVGFANVALLASRYLGAIFEWNLHLIQL